MQSGTVNVRGLENLRGFTPGLNRLSLAIQPVEQKDDQLYFQVVGFAITGQDCNQSAIYALEKPLKGVGQLSDNTMQIDISDIGSAVCQGGFVDSSKVYDILRNDPKITLIEVNMDYQASPEAGNSRISSQETAPRSQAQSPAIAEMPYDESNIADNSEESGAVRYTLRDNLPLTGGDNTGYQTAFTVNSINVITPDGQMDVYTMEHPTTLIIDPLSHRISMVAFQQMIGSVNRGLTTQYTEVSPVIVAQPVIVQAPIVMPDVQPIPINFIQTQYVPISLENWPGVFIMDISQMKDIKPGINPPPHPPVTSPGQNDGPTPATKTTPPTPGNQQTTGSTGTPTKENGGTTRTTTGSKEINAGQTGTAPSTSGRVTSSDKQPAGKTQVSGGKAASPSAGDGWLKSLSPGTSGQTTTATKSGQVQPNTGSRTGNWPTGGTKSPGSTATGKGDSPTGQGTQTGLSQRTASGTGGTYNNPIMATGSGIKSTPSTTRYTPSSSLGTTGGKTGGVVPAVGTGTTGQMGTRMSPSTGMGTSSMGMGAMGGKTFGTSPSTGMGTMRGMGGGGMGMSPGASGMRSVPRK